jgi:hypothetical protein
VEVVDDGDASEVEEVLAVLPGWNGMVTPAGQVRRPAVKSMLNWSLANRQLTLRAPQALQ